MKMFTFPCLTYGRNRRDHLDREGSIGIAETPRADFVLWTALAPREWEPNQRGRIVLNFVTCSALDVVYNKLVPNVFPFPWFAATLALAAGSVTLSPSLASCYSTHMGHGTAIVSMSNVDGSFAHITCVRAVCQSSVCLHQDLR